MSDPRPDDRRAPAGAPPGALVSPPAPAADDDEAVVRAAQRGEGGAFDRLYARFGRLVHGLLLARVPAADADDLVQDVFLQAYQRLGDLREPRAFGGWLVMIAKRRALDYHRSARPVAELGDTDVAGPDGRRLDDGLAVLGALRRLPEAYRDTLVLRLVENMTGPEIAERTGLTHGSVRVNLHRGMQLLRDLLDGDRGRR